MRRAVTEGVTRAMDWADMRVVADWIGVHRGTLGVCDVAKAVHALPREFPSTDQAIPVINGAN